MTITAIYSGTVGHSVTVQWYKDGVALVDGDYDGVIVSGSTSTQILTEAENTITLTITDPTAEWDGAYYAYITDNDVEDCELSTDPLNVLIPDVCRLEITIQPIEITTEAGNEVELTFSYTGAQGGVTIQWYKDDVALVDGPSGGSTISGATTATLNISNSEEALTGNYYAIIIDDGVLDCSLQTDTVLVTIQDVCALEITVQPEGGEFFVGEDVDMTVGHTGEVGAVSYQWSLNGVPLVDGASGDSIISGATTDTLLITNIQLPNAGNYTVVVTDAGVAECVATSVVASVGVEEATPPENMYIWWKADGETGFGSGDLALPLQDFSGFNYDGVNGGHLPVNPVWEPAQLNGLAGFVWNDPDRVGLVETDPINLPASGFPVVSTGYSFAIVINRVALNPNSGLNDIDVTSLDDSASVRARMRLLASGSDVTYTHFGYSSSNSCNLTVPLDTWQIITGTFDFVEGVPRLLSNDLSSVGSVGSGSIFLNLALLQGTADQIVVELLYYNVKLSDADLAQLRTYLSEKWNIPITV